MGEKPVKFKYVYLNGQKRESAVVTAKDENEAWYELQKLPAYRKAWGFVVETFVWEKGKWKKIS
jgi:hypothetical protein